MGSSLADNTFLEVKPGSVWLVDIDSGLSGPLPGSASQAIQQADFVIYDSSLGHRVLTLLPQNTLAEETVGGAAAVARRAAALAGAGWRVVRLVEAAPFSVSDSAEETRLLRCAGIATRRIVADASSSRTLESLFALIDIREGEEENILPIARSTRSMLLSLTGRSLPRIVALLRQEGFDGATALAQIDNPGTARQRVHETSLADYREGDGGTEPATRVILAVGSDLDLHRESAASAKTYPLGYSMAGLAG